MIPNKHDAHPLSTQKIYDEIVSKFGKFNLHYTKIQHYVPQCYMKNFSNCTKRKLKITGDEIKHDKTYKTNIYPPKDGHSLLNVEKICNKNYTYGSDCLVESAYSEIENMNCPIITEILVSNTVPDKILNFEKYYFFVEFIATLYYRSVRMYCDQQSYLRLKLDTFTLSYGITDFEITTPFDDIPNQIISGDNSWLINASKMKSSLLINNTAVDFISSDNPLCVYNPIYLIKKHNEVYDLSTPASLWYIPLCPKKALIFYDPEYYSIDSKIVEINDQEQITELNKLEVYNSYDYILYKNEKDESYVTELYKHKINNPNISKEESFKSFGVGFYIKNEIIMNFLKIIDTTLTYDDTKSRHIKLNNTYNVIIGKMLYENDEFKDAANCWIEYLQKRGELKNDEECKLFAALVVALKNEYPKYKNNQNNDAQQ